MHKSEVAIQSRPPVLRRAALAEVAFPSMPTLCDDWQLADLQLHAQACSLMRQHLWQAPTPCRNKAASRGQILIALLSGRVP